jgi:hypothetical protein
MKAVVSSLVLSMIAAEGQAATGIEITGMTCAQVQSRLDREGVAMLRYRSARNPSLPVYGQYVASGRFCRSGQMGAISTIPTTDTSACPVRKCVRIYKGGRR